MSFVSETDVKAVRKRHRCDGCGRNIDIGQPAKRWAGTTDGEFCTAIYHVDCREAECALNKLSDTYHPDEWQALREIDSEDWPWLRDTFPAVAHRMGIGAPRAVADS
jgi:hypothetical protein